MGPDTARLVAAILNDAWMVRHYARGGRSSIQRPQRAEAIRRLALSVRDALNVSQDFEPLLIALVDGLSARDEPPF